MKTRTHYGPQFNASRYESEIINRIANRAVAMANNLGIEYDKMTATMDVMACHCNGCPLDLAKLETVDDGTFGHDVFGIRRHIDRSSGKLTDCFLPRLALPDSVSA
jgi:hypothetical protein